LFAVLAGRLLLRGRLIPREQLAAATRDQFAQGLRADYLGMWP
jgi:hypothetical protein